MRNKCLSQLYGGEMIVRPGSADLIRVWMVTRTNTLGQLFGIIERKHTQDCWTLDQIESFCKKNRNRMSLAGFTIFKTFGGFVSVRIDPRGFMSTKGLPPSAKFSDRFGHHIVSLH